MKINPKLFSTIINILLMLTLATATSGCNFIQGILNSPKTSESISSNTNIKCQVVLNSSKTSESISSNKNLKWKDIKERLKVKDPDVDDLNQLIYLSIEIGEVNEVIDLFKSTLNNDIKVELLDKLSIFISNNYQVSQLYKQVALSQNKLLSPLALRRLIGTELSDDSNKKNQWSNWQWSQDVKNLLEEAVDKRMYKLSGLEYHEMLRLAERYPNSKLVKGAQEYRKFAGGDFYFGYSKKPLQKNEVPPVLRTPFNSQREINFWSSFLEKYPDHPGTDDALYRVARAYEVQENYEQAILWYYKSSQAPDQGLSESAQSRILFLIDLVMTSESITKLMKSQFPKELIPLFSYSKAVHLIREGKLSEAITEIENFIKTYKGKNLKEVFVTGIDGIYIGRKSKFWDNLSEQIKSLKKLQDIRNQKLTDKKLYEEASFWFYNYLTEYNYMWRGRQVMNFSKFIPEKWEGAKTSEKKIVSFEFINKVGHSYETQNGSLKSIELLQKLLESFPNSELKEKASYSIALNYWYLGNEGWILPPTKSSSWFDLSSKSFYDFINKYPKSSLADDALFSISSLKNIETPERLQILEKYLMEYPNEDRKKEVETAIECIKGKTPSRETSGSPMVEIGITIDNFERRNNEKIVYISYVFTDSPAHKKNLRGGDVVVKIDGRSIFDKDDIFKILRNHQTGESIHFLIEREGKQQSIDIKA